MDVTVDFDETMATTALVIQLQDDGRFRVRCSPAIDVETLLALNRDVAQSIVDTVANRR